MSTLFQPPFTDFYCIQPASGIQDTILRFGVLTTTANVVKRVTEHHTHGIEQYLSMRKLMLVHKFIRISIVEQA